MEIPDNKLIMPYCRLFYDLAKFSKKQSILLDPLSMLNGWQSDNVSISLNGLPKTLSISTNKLLALILHHFKLQNTNNTTENLNYNVRFPLSEYYNYCEISHSNDSLKNFRRFIRKDLDILFQIVISCKEKIKGKDKDFSDLRIISTKGIKQGFLEVTINPTFGIYLQNLQNLTFYHTGLFKIDARNANAYNVGLLLTRHTYITHGKEKLNQKPYLKISTILKYTNLPVFTSLKKNRLSWENRIKEAFETALDNLTNTVLADWHYCNSTGEDISTFKNYYEWEESYLKYTII